MNNETKFLGIDYGEVRIGIAISDVSKKFSFIRDHLLNDKTLLPKIFDLCKSENISRIIIGYPLNFKSEKTIQTLNVENFKTELETYLRNKIPGIETVFFDERLTSKLAEAAIRGSGMKKSKRREKGMVDSYAARILLQDYLDRGLN